MNLGRISVFKWWDIERLCISMVINIFEGVIYYMIIHNRQILSEEWFACIKHRRVNSYSMVVTMVVMVETITFSRKKFKVHNYVEMYINFYKDKKLYKQSWALNTFLYLNTK